MKKFFLLCLIIIIAQMLFSQAKSSSDIDQWLFEQPADGNQAVKRDSVLTNDLIKVNYAKKDAKLAMLMSMVLPGAGQFYADKSSITTYIFPVLEVAFLGGWLYYDQQGKKKTDEYEKYANGETIVYTKPDGSTISSTRYRRDYQSNVQSFMIGINATDIYEPSYFRLDNTNTQHFYEDIGKYGHYTFGWIDWYYRFALDSNGVVAPVFVFENAGSANAMWIGNRIPGSADNSTTYKPDFQSTSPMRYKYIDMRNDAKAEYSKSRFFTFAIAFNHLASGIDAVRLTHKVNRLSLSQAAPQLNIYAAMPDGNITPMLGVKWEF
ncbi:MAG: hypothetical protein CVU50_04225 [Candidatus Cloacimonetes bacterium HGW-Cloacimonetes-3]|nr:MAG: hypothetical protein CVU50_04225 [Candidatus Cloacimonetes bacterium HGW-Cloacimonetes-3]